MDLKYQIFISSTYEDLKEERQTIIQAILKHYHFPIGMEMFNAEDDEQWDIIKATIDTSDIYVLLLGHRYGSLTKEKISYTEKEFNYALERKKQGKIKILCFLRQDNIELAINKLEKDKTAIQKLKKFKDKIMNSHLMVDFWDYKGTLAEIFSPALGKAIKSLNEHPEKNAGWLNVNSIAEQLTEIKQLQRIKNLMFESCREHEIAINETETYTIDELGNCIITRDRTQECKCDMSFGFTKYISDKPGDNSRVIDIIDLSSGAKLDYLIHRNDQNSFSFFTLFEKQMRAGDTVKYRTVSFAQYYLSNLVDHNQGTIQFEPFSGTKIKSKKDTFIFKNVKKFKKLKVTLKIFDDKSTITKTISPEINQGKIIYRINYPIKSLDKKFLVEFSITK